MKSNEEELIVKFNAHKPEFINLLGGNVENVSTTPPSCIYKFVVGNEYCHSTDIVQGGFVSAMLDAAMSHAAYAIEKEVIGVSTIEMSTHYIAPTHAGKVIASGRVRSESYRIAFLEGELHDSSGKLTATSKSTVKITRKRQ